MRRKRIDVLARYSGSLLGYLGGRSLKRSLKRIGARPLELSPAEDRNGFAMKRDVARQLGISSLSDLKRYWPAAAATGSTPLRARAAADDRQNDQWAVAPGSVLDLPGRGSSPTAPASPSPSSTPARGRNTPTSRRTSGPTSTRFPTTTSTTTTTATSTTSTASTSPAAGPGRTSATDGGTAPTSPASSRRRATAAASSASPRARS